MSLQVEVDYDNSYVPEFTFTYSSDDIRCLAKYSGVDSDDWRRFAENLRLVVPDDLEFGTDFGGSKIEFNGAMVFFCTSNYNDASGWTQFMISREKCLETFQHIVDVLDAWEATVDL